MLTWEARQSWIPPIAGLAEAAAVEDVHIFHAGTRLAGGVTATVVDHFEVVEVEIKNGELLA